MTTIAPDVEAIEDWIEALESGEYKQGKKFLLCGGRYCCLGVAARSVGVSDGAIEDRFYLTTTRASAAVAVGLGPGLIPDDAEGALATLNDDHRLTFDQIAYVLRECLLKPLKEAGL